uniref:Uncharacterized protein n=1 Tax=Magnetococcus massalia (strain MO-1) TaxID=451514 RepID=A0A1S7LEA1_MAGMO|nr:Membrane protein of unknown function [Candidatus Magnetococcus massalia]
MNPFIKDSFLATFSLLIAVNILILFILSGVVHVESYLFGSDSTGEALVIYGFFFGVIQYFYAIPWGGYLATKKKWRALIGLTTSSSISLAANILFYQYVGGA